LRNSDHLSRNAETPRTAGFCEPAGAPSGLFLKPEHLFKAAWRFLYCLIAKIYPFGAVFCLAAFAKKTKIEKGKPKSLSFSIAEGIIGENVPYKKIC